MPDQSYAGRARPRRACIQASHRRRPDRPASPGRPWRGSRSGAGSYSSPSSDTARARRAGSPQLPSTVAVRPSSRRSSAAIRSGTNPSPSASADSSRSQSASSSARSAPEATTRLRLASQARAGVLLEQFAHGLERVDEDAVLDSDSSSSSSSSRGRSSGTSTELYPSGARTSRPGACGTHPRRPQPAPRSRTRRSRSASEVTTVSPSPAIAAMSSSAAFGPRRDANRTSTRSESRSNAAPSSTTTTSPSWSTSSSASTSRRIAPRRSRHQPSGRDPITFIPSTIRRPTAAPSSVPPWTNEDPMPLSRPLVPTGSFGTLPNPAGSCSAGRP